MLVGLDGLKQQQEFECFKLQNCYVSQEITLPFYA